MIRAFPPADVELGRTHWSRIHQLAGPPAGDDSSRTSWEDAWMYLWDTFRPAMLATVRRTLARLGGGVVRVEDAEDVVQSFFVACLEHGYLAKADPEMGRFRAFATVCLRRHTAKYVEYARRKKRSPATPPKPLEHRAADPVDLEAAAAWDAVFEMEWTRCLLDAALPRVGARSQANEQLLRILFENPEADADTIALQLGVGRAKIPVRLHRARRMLAEELWEIVKQTVATTGELEEERARLNHLLAHHLTMATAPSLFSCSSDEAGTVPADTDAPRGADDASPRRRT